MFQYIVKLFLIQLLFSFVFCQYFYIPQDSGFNIAKWSEIDSDTILIPKIGPFNNDHFINSKINKFYRYRHLSGALINIDMYNEINLYDADCCRYKSHGSIAISLSSKLELQNYFEFDSKGLNDPSFLGVERGFGNGWVGYIQHSSLTYSYLNSHFSVGRGNPYFYNLNQSLLINPHSKPFEYFWWQHKYKKIEFDWGVLFLNDDGFLKNRLITFHRYGYSNSSFRVGFTEAVLVTYLDIGSSELGYLMPASVLLETEENRGVNSNLIWLIDGLIKFNNLTVYGEILIDDFAIDGKSPPQLASSIGVGSVLKGNLLVNLEYTLIKRWVGNHCDGEKVWVDNSIPIGHAIGPDSQSLLISAYKLINDNVALELSSNFNNNGLGDAVDRLIEEFPVDCDRNFGYNHEKFPSSTNVSYNIDMTLFYYYKNKLQCQISIQNNSIDSMSSKFSVVYKF